jgi:N-acetylglucosamine kinase-like BadF-type ATPase
MIAVVYSGTKTAIWKIAKDGKTIAECSMPGINPFFVDQKTLLQQLNKKTILINHAEQIKKIHVFAAGATSAEKRNELASSLSLFFKFSKITVQDDLYGAALAACFHQTGIVGILGSGSNCAYFNGNHPVPNNFGLGFILGDEGSANYLGKIILKYFLQEKLPADLLKKFRTKYDLNRSEILERVYKKSLAQQFLSSFLDFYIENKEHPYIQQLIDDAFQRYISTYLLPTLKLHPGKEIHFVGIVAGNFQDRLHLAAKRSGFEITTITKEPIYKLLNYYSN